MSLPKALNSYLRSVRGDANQPEWIDRLIVQIKGYQKIPLEETRADSKRIAEFVLLLFALMPELERADPEYKKLYPLYLYCESKLKLQKKVRRAGPA